MKIVQLLAISISMMLCCSIAAGQNASILHIIVADDQGNWPWDMVFGNHINATWGVNGEKDSLDPVYIEREFPASAPGFEVYWRPARSGVSWGKGYLKYDIKGWADTAQSDTFKLFFIDAMEYKADITLSWSNAETLGAHCQSMLLRIVGGDTIDMFTQTSITIPDAGDNGIFTAYIYKMGAFLVECIGEGCTSEAKKEILSYPEVYHLTQNYPNPTNPISTITFDLPKASHVTLNVYNTLGQLVAALVDAQYQSGRHDVQFDGSELPSGVYFYRIVAGEFIDTKKMAVVK